VEADLIRTAIKTGITNELTDRIETEKADDDSVV